MAQQQLRQGWILKCRGKKQEYLSRENRRIPPPLSFPAPGCSHLCYISMACPNFLLCCFYSRCIPALCANFKEAAPGAWARRRLCLPGAITLQPNFILHSAFHANQLGKTLGMGSSRWGEGRGAVPREGMEGDVSASSICIPI